METFNVHFKFGWNTTDLCQSLFRKFSACSIMSKSMQDVLIFIVSHSILWIPMQFSFISISFSAPAPCQSKSSGKPEINPQEFTQLQQQLQDLKEQVRRQERLLHLILTTSTEHARCLRSSLVKRACWKLLPQFLYKPKRFRKPGKRRKVPAVFLQGSNLKELFTGSFVEKLKIVRLLIFPSLSVLPKCTTYVAFVYSVLLFFQVLRTFTALST